MSVEQQHPEWFGQPGEQLTPHDIRIPKVFQALRESTPLNGGEAVRIGNSRALWYGHRHRRRGNMWYSTILRSKGYKPDLPDAPGPNASAVCVGWSKIPRDGINPNLTTQQRGERPQPGSSKRSGEQQPEPVARRPQHGAPSAARKGASGSGVHAAADTPASTTSSESEPSPAAARKPSQLQRQAKGLPPHLRQPPEVPPPLPTPAEHAEMRERLQTDLRRLRSQVTGLEADVDSHKKRAEHLSESLNAERKEKYQLREQLKQAERNAQPPGQLSEARRKAAQLQQDLADAKGRAENAEAVSTELADQVAAAKEQAAELQNAVKIARQRRDELRNERDKARDERDALQQKLTQLMQKCNALQHDIKTCDRIQAETATELLETSALLAETQLQLSAANTATAEAEVQLQTLQAAQRRDQRDLQAAEEAKGKLEAEMEEVCKLVGASVVGELEQAKGDPNAYKKLAKTHKAVWHPDRNRRTPTLAAAMFKFISNTEAKHFPPTPWVPDNTWDNGSGRPSAPDDDEGESSGPSGTST